MRTVLTAAAFALLVTTPLAASETWNVIEGQQGVQKGGWNVQIEGADLAAQAKMTGPHGLPVTYRVTGKIEKGVYSLKRQAASDHVDCVYRGEMRGDGAIVGSATCNGAPGPWIARPVHK